MPIYTVQGPDGKTYTVEGPAGATAEQVGQFVMSQRPSAPQQQNQAPQQTERKFGSSLNDFVGGIPRQIGLTARYALEGPAQAAQVFTEPIAGLMRYAGMPAKPLGEIATTVADKLGLPSPQTSQERVVGDATRLLGGSGGMLGGAQALSRLPGMVGQAGAALAVQPMQQLSAATGGGLLGGVSKENGGSELQQVGSALLGSVAGGMVPGAINSMGNVVRRFRATPQQLDIKIAQTLKSAGVDYNQVPERVKQGLRAELGGALATDKELDPAAVARLAEFKSLGVTPTRGMVSQDPVQITREMNLAKTGANSADGQLQGLARIQNQNNARLINVMNEAGAGRADPMMAGESVVSSVLGKQTQLRNSERAAWDAAKNSPGYRQPISSKVISDINQTLGDEGLMPFMNPTISRYMEAFQTGQPFTPQDYRNLQSMLSREIAKGGNEGAAASFAARVLRNADVQPITNPRGIDFGNSIVTGDVAQRLRAMDAAPESAINAVNRARAATKDAYSYEDSNRLVRSILSDSASSDPAKIAQRYIVGGTPDEARMVLQEVGPQGVPVIKNAILSHLKEKALNGAQDEVGKFSQSSYNKALSQIGERKLSLFFTPDELKQLNSVGRVASLMQSQPVGSAVNNSNSGALLLGRGVDALDKIPVIGPMVAPALKNIEVSLQQRQAQKLLPGLLAMPTSESAVRGLLTPALAYSGGLLSPP